MILLLGSNGFLGKNVKNKLKEINIPFRETSLSQGVDLRNREEAFNLFKIVKPKTVINCSAYVGGIQFGLQNEADIFINNLKIITNIYEASVINGVDRIINPISNCIYPGEHHYFKIEEIWNGPLHPSVFVYGMVRKMLLVASQAFKSQHGLNTLNIIFSNMYGPGDHFDEIRSHALGALVFKIINAKKNKQESVTVWGTGEPVREWLYVKDAAEALVRAINTVDSVSPINVGVGYGISIKELAEKIKLLMNYNGNLVFDPTKLDGALHKTMDGKSGEVYFNWSPQTFFEEGLIETIRWYENSLSRIN